MKRLLFSRSGWRILYLLVDGASAVAAWESAIVLRLYVPMPWTASLLPRENAAFGELLIIPVLATQVAVILWFFGFYDHVAPVPRLRLSLRVISVSVIQGLILSGVLFLLDLTFPRSVIPVFIALNTLFLLLGRLVLQHYYRPWRRKVILVGSGEGALELARNIGSHHWHGLDVVGHVTVPDEIESGEDPVLGPRLGSVDELPELVTRLEIDDLILAASTDNWKSQMVHRMAGNSATINLLLVPDAFESLLGRMRYRWVHDIPLIEVIARSESRLGHPLKRAFDLVVGSVMLLVALPVMMVVACLIRFTDSGPVLFRQVRIGQNRREFTLVKFRTMRVGAEDDREEVLAVQDDPRLISVGKSLRALRLDEWPQLWNVLKGEMSLVGPRPERPGFVQRYLQEVIGYGERFSARPGLTGLAQVNGDYHSSAENKLRYDLAYIANRSLWLDLSILFRTVKTVLTTRGT